MRAALLLLTTVCAVRAAEPAPGAAILQDLKSFNTVGSVLHVAAHPDDENRPLLAFLSRGRGYRTGYLSVTRGDGGQNEIGPEFGEKLGVARTQELLAGRRFDGARQFFTRAIDFGYSKSMDETLAFWDRKEVLGDVVRVIRTFRPDVIVTRFAPQAQRGNHGHHNASAVLALEAFKLAGDPKAFPEQLGYELSPWQATRIVQNGGGGNSLTLQAGGTDAATGDTFRAIAGRTSAAHKTQFGTGGGGGGRGGGGGESWTENFSLLDGTPGTGDLMDGIDLTWGRVPNGAEIGRLAEAAIASFKGDDPAASVPALLEIRKQLRNLGASGTTADKSFISRGSGANRVPLPLPNTLGPVLNDKLDQLDRIIVACLGLEVSTTVPQAEVVPGEKVKWRLQASVRSKAVPVTLEMMITPESMLGMNSLRVEPGKPLVQEWEEEVAAKTPLTHPYWLREEPAAGIARVSDPALIGRPENPPDFLFGYIFQVGDQTIELTDQPVTAATAGSARPRRLVAIPPVSLRFASEVSLFTPGSSKPVLVEAVAARAKTAGTVKLNVPAGWKVTPASQPMKFEDAGDKRVFTFTVSAPPQAVTGRMSASADIGGQSYSNQRVVIDYPHLPLQLLQPPATARLVSVEFQAKGKNVGYLPGAGDATVEALEQLGYKVTTLSGADLTAEKLKDLDAVVIGVRAFNERTDFKDNLPGLLAYVENGGTVVAQYNRPNGLNVPQLGPYQLSIAGSPPALRVTDETAKVSFLAPENPALNVPNKITNADFDGWVQERGAYFPSSWDQAAYTPLLAMSDPDEAPLKSSVLIAKHGKGYYVYTGLAFFRQLPAGVPGSYRLFANLVSLGK